MHHTGRLAALLGDLATADRLAERAFQLGQEAEQPDAALVYGAQLSYVCVHEGRCRETIEMLERSVSAYPGIPPSRAGWPRACAGSTVEPKP